MRASARRLAFPPGMREMLRAACVIAASAALLAGCASNGSGEEGDPPPDGTPQGQERSEPKPPPSPPRNEKTVRFGTVDSVRAVTLPGTNSGVGAVVGGVVGGVAGSEVGKGRGSAVGAVLGSVAGSMAGEAIEGKLTQRDALEILVELNTGELRAIVQEVSADAFQPGDRVRLVTGGGITRVEKIPNN